MNFEELADFIKKLGKYDAYKVASIIRENGDDKHKSKSHTSESYLFSSLSEKTISEISDYVKFVRGREQYQKELEDERKQIADELKASITNDDVFENKLCNWKSPKVMIETIDDPALKAVLRAVKLQRDMSPERETPEIPSKKRKRKEKLSPLEERLKQLDREATRLRNHQSQLNISKRIDVSEIITNDGTEFETISLENDVNSEIGSDVEGMMEADPDVDVDSASNAASDMDDEDDGDDETTVEIGEAGTYIAKPATDKKIGIEVKPPNANGENSDDEFDIEIRKTLKKLLKKPKTVTEIVDEETESETEDDEDDDEAEDEDEDTPRNPKLVVHPGVTTTPQKIQFEKYLDF